MNSIGRANLPYQSRAVRRKIPESIMSAPEDSKEYLLSESIS